MKINFHRYLSMLLPSVVILIVFLSGCQSNNNSLPIAVSKESEAYTKWLLHNNSQIVTTNLYGMPIDSAIDALSQCKGLLLTGGEDVYPAYYNKEYDTNRCGTFNSYRDSLEFALINFALRNKMPIVGVCRGEQILNVALGGSLIIDIPQDFDTTVIHRQADWKNCFHPVWAVDNSLLKQLTNTNLDTVTSNHHQAIDLLADPLKIEAYTADSLPEAISWKDPKNKGFLLAVQWHPERMNWDHPFSKGPAQGFISKAQLFGQ